MCLRQLYLDLKILRLNRRDFPSFRTIEFRTLMHDEDKKKFPINGWIGVVLIAVFWYLNWGLDGLRTHWGFFPLWLGYILTVDGFAVLSGRPSIARNIRTFILLFILSMPGWWIFEWINERVYYWEYIPLDSFSRQEYYFWSTLNFSTVIPAVFVSSNLLAGLNWFQKHHFRLKVVNSSGGRMLFFVAGWLMLAGVLIWPDRGMAFLWMSLFFILDPINYWLGNRSILRHTERGDWRLVGILFIATLICGFFWEMWNYYSWPKWIYTFPFLNQFPIFEMPIAGYLGYLPFGLELYALVALVEGWIGLRWERFVEG